MVPAEPELAEEEKEEKDFSSTDTFRGGDEAAEEVEVEGDVVS